MKIESKWASVILVVALILGSAGLTWINVVLTFEDWRSYRTARPEKVLVETVRTMKRRVSLEVTTTVYIEVQLWVRCKGEGQFLTATFMGETPEHAADIVYLASNKGREIELWIDPRGNGRFSLRHEVPLYRAGLLAISGLMTLFFTWILIRVLEPGARP